MFHISAPGKILLIGGYSILEKGNLGYTLAVNQRVHSFLSPYSEDSIIFELEDFNLKVKAEFMDGKLFPSRPLSQEEEKYFNFTKTASELALRYLEEKEGIEGKGLKIKTKNDEGFTYQYGKSKSGFGSSSASVVSIVGSFFEFYQLPVEEHRDTIHKLSQVAHYLAQRKVGSGFDVATATYGPIVYSRYSPSLLEGELSKVVSEEWDCFIKEVSFPKELDIVCAFTGDSADTREMVRKINKLKEKREEDYLKLIREIDGYNRKAILALESLEKKFSENMLEEFVENFNLGWELTKELGNISGAKISTPKYDKLCRLAIKEGAYCAKLPGAGGGDPIIAIIPKESDPKERILKAWEKEGLLPLPNLKVSNQGLMNYDET